MYDPLAYSRYRRMPHRWRRRNRLARLWWRIWYG
jgi:hypothetical protein